jgi:WD40 repeat protein
VTEAELRNRLLQDPVPGEQEAGRRAWEVVRSSYASRERVPWIERHSRLVLVLAVLAALTVAAVTPPGRAVVDTVRERVAQEPPPEDAFDRVPGGGRLLVLSASGPWVVQEDGSKRLLGHYEDASWSPRGLFVVATQGGRLVTLDPETGDVRWSLSHSEPVADARWSGGGLDTRIAYRAGSSLHVVAGDGAPDAVLAENVPPVAPAWQPGSHVLAYVGGDQRIHVLDVDSRQELWRTPSVNGVRQLLFDDGRVVAVTAREIWVFGRHKRVLFERVARGHSILSAALVPVSGVVFADYDDAADATELISPTCSTSGACLLIPDIHVYRGAGRVGDLTTSPDGRWFAAASPDADQFLFFRRVPRLGKVVSVSDVTREFDPGGTGTRAFPHVAGWVQEVS